MKLTATFSSFGDAFLAVNRNCDLAIGLSCHAFIERDECVMEPLVTAKWRAAIAPGLGSGEALQGLETLDPPIEIVQSVQFEHQPQGLREDGKAVKFKGDVGALPFQGHDGNAIDADGGGARRGEAVNAVPQEFARQDAAQFVARGSATGLSQL